MFELIFIFHKSLKVKTFLGATITLPTLRFAALPSHRLFVVPPLTATASPRRASHPPHRGTTRSKGTTWQISRQHTECNGDSRRHQSRTTHGTRPGLGALLHSIWYPPTVFLEAKPYSRLSFFLVKEHPRNIFSSQYPDPCLSPSSTISSLVVNCGPSLLNLLLVTHPH